jgi:hypothetical protein
LLIKKSHNPFGKMFKKLFKKLFNRDKDEINTDDYFRPPRPAEVTRLPRPENEYSVSQLFEEFNTHLAAELSDGACKNKLEGHINQFCSNNTPSVTHEALQAVANQFANCICDHFVEKMTQKVEAAQKAPWRMQLPSQPLRNTFEYEEFLSTFVERNLPRFYDPHDKAVENIAKQAVENVSRRVDVPPELMPGLAQLALYDFIIFCGMSVFEVSLEEHSHLRRRR